MPMSSPQMTRMFGCCVSGIPTRSQERAGDASSRPGDSTPPRTLVRSMSSPAADRYERMTYNRCGRSGLQLPAVSLGLWQNFGDDRPLDTSRAIVRRAFDLGITHFDLANNYGPPYGSAEENFGRLLRDDFAPYRDELVDLDEGRLRHVARPVRRMGLAQVPAREPRPEPRSGWASSTSTSSTRTASTRTRRSRRRWARSTRAVRQGKALYVGISSYSAGEDARGGRDPARPGHAAADPPALVLDAEPLDRARPARHAGRARRRLHRASRRWRRACSPTGTSTGIPEGSRASRNELAVAGPAHRRDAGQDPRAERDRRAPRPDARADGARLDAARPAGDLDARRREQRRAARGQRRPRSTTSTSPTTSWPRSTATRPRASINIWSTSSSE